MSPAAYYLLCMLIALAVAAVLSAIITRSLRRRVVRAQQALVLGDALARYSIWLGAVRPDGSIDAQRDTAGRALLDASECQSHGFPELALEFGRLVELDRELDDLRVRQQRLKEQDLEAWLVSDHEAQHLRIVGEQQALLENLMDRLPLPQAADLPT